MWCRRFTWIALATWPLWAQAQALPPAERRAQIVAEREAVEADHRRRIEVCAREFTQTACTDGARRERRRELDRLGAELAAIDLAERRRRAAERGQRIDEKQQAAARQAARPSPAVATVPRPSKVASDLATATRARRLETSAAEEAAAAASARQAARTRRLAEQKAHADAVRLRNDERAKRRSPAAPLPAEPASVLR